MSHPLRIALAEDEAELRVWCRKLLSRLGHQVVVEAENGRELVEQCRLQHPDLVLTDVRMPEMTGLEAARLISQDGPIPIILMSAHLDPRSLPCAESEHIVGFLVKPFNQGALETMLKQACAPAETSDGTGGVSSRIP